MVDTFQFPLGVYPVEECKPRAGYTVEFEPADGGEQDGDWEEWPDRYVFDIVVSAHRVGALCRRLWALFPGRVYPILDVLGQDEYRELDPYISYDLVGLDVVLDCVARYRDYFFEDGLCGFGAMSEEPFVYMFVDEHKICTVRVLPEMKERVEKVLEAFDLGAMRAEDPPAGVDSCDHEHRGVLVTPEDAPTLRSAEEILEELRDAWHLYLNVDPARNEDEDGKELGATPWRCVVRCLVVPSSAPAADAGPAEGPVGEEIGPGGGGETRYGEILLRAACLRDAEHSALSAVENLAWASGLDLEEGLVLVSDRLSEESVRDLIGIPKGGQLKALGAELAPGEAEAEVYRAQWLPEEGPAR